MHFYINFSATLSIDANALCFKLYRQNGCIDILHVGQCVKVEANLICAQWGNKPHPTPTR